MNPRRARIRGDRDAATTSKRNRVLVFRRLVEFDTGEYRPGLDQAEQDLDAHTPDEA
ncbi:hypothetical protein P8605_31610 [Streptomyces sp. T-3]|nr:hypothetical protein [Streptomyces sp. T-3]